MTKANKAIFWSLVVCVMALVVGLCFVGTTFARYTSSGSGTGEVYVATWDVDVTPSASFDASLTASPSDAEYSGSEYDSSAARSNKSQPQLAAKIVNTGSVAALVTAELDETAGLTFNWDGDAITEDSADTDWRFSSTYESFQSTAASHFSIEILKITDATGPVYGSLSEDGETVDAIDGELEIYADVLWTSDIEGCFGDDANEFDSFCGMYLESISFTIKFNAVQASAN